MDQTAKPDDQQAHDDQHDVPQEHVRQQHVPQGQVESGDARLQPSRRDFLKTVMAAGAGLAISPRLIEAAPVRRPAAHPGPAVTPKPAVRPPAVVKAPPRPSDIHIAIIGPGNQGRNLMVNCLRIPGVRFVAACDIWPFAQTYAKNALHAFKQDVNIYADYREMLDHEKSLDAVIIATPDWMHSEQTVACLKAGKHVYSEKEMSNTIEGARAMVLAQRETGKLLQIGHQRRSNPRYWKGDSLIHKSKTLGRVMHTYGQWNRATPLDLGWSKKVEMDTATLEKYGYDTMERFRNWRWFKKFSGGPIADLGSHQIDIFNWFLHSTPTTVQAMATSDHPEFKNREWYDAIMATFRYDTPEGPASGFYEVLNSTSYGGYYELFHGDRGTLEISEDVARGKLFLEPAAPHKDWEQAASEANAQGAESFLLNIGSTLGAKHKGGPSATALTGGSEKPPHMLHLENFFDAIRGKTKLTCPPEVGFETAVTVLKVNEAVASGGSTSYDPKEFTVPS